MEGMVRNSGWQSLHESVAEQGRDLPSLWPHEEFAARLEAVLARARWDIEALNDLGNHLFREGAIEHARLCFERAAKDARAIGAQMNVARCDIRLGQPEAAATRARALLAAEPQLATAWQLLCESLIAQQQLVEARHAAQQAAELQRDNATLYKRWAALCELTGDVEGSMRAYQQAWRLDDADVHSLRMLVFNMRTLCSWRNLPLFSARLMQELAKGNEAVSPFDLLVEPSSAAQQLACARLRAARMARGVERMPVLARGAGKGRPRKLRAGFVSHGFGLHPTTILSVALFERLRAFGLEVHLFSTSDDHGHALRNRLGAGVDTFHDVSGWPSRNVAERVNGLDIEVLVDMDGHGRMHGLEVFPYRPSPLQVSWLAYPGTSGANFIDYVIADRFVLPEWLQPHFSEKVAYLPRCYQCTDPTRKVIRPPSRVACGLPVEGVVYACFNTSYKLNPHGMRRMFRVLAGVPGSVLWLMKGPGRSVERLRQAAAQAGIAPSRLVFMEKMPHEAYLSRYRHADLFLDTDG